MSTVRQVRPRPRHIAYAAGLGLIAVGVGGLILHAADTRPPVWALWYAGGVIAHDLLLAPAIIAGSLLLTRLPAPWRAPLQAGLLVGGSLAAIALPAVLGYGRRAANPSILPLDYPRNLAAVLVVVAAGTATAALLRAYGPAIRAAVSRTRATTLALLTHGRRGHSGDERRSGADPSG